MKNLGYANGWEKTPEIVKECQGKKHNPPHHKTTMRCVTRVGCEICGYYYHIDSGGQTMKLISHIKECLGFGPRKPAKIAYTPEFIGREKPEPLTAREIIGSIAAAFALFAGLVCWSHGLVAVWG